MNDRAAPLHPLALAAVSLLSGFGVMGWLSGTTATLALWLQALLPLGALLGGSLVLLSGPALATRLVAALWLAVSAAWWLDQPVAGLALALLAAGGWTPVLIGRPAAALPAAALGAALLVGLLSSAPAGTLDTLLRYAIPAAALLVLPLPFPRSAAQEDLEPVAIWRLLPVLLLAAPLTLLPLLWAPVEIARVTSLAASQWQAMLWPALLLGAPVLWLSALLKRRLGNRMLLAMALLTVALSLPWLAAQLRTSVHPQLASFRAKVPLTLVSVDCATQDPCAQVREHLLALGLDVRLREQPVPEPWLELDGQAVDLLSLEWLGNALASFNFPASAEPQTGPARVRLAVLAALSALLLLPWCALLGRLRESWLVLPLVLTALLGGAPLLDHGGRLLVMHSGLAQAGVWAWSALAGLALLATLLVPRRA